MMYSQRYHTVLISKICPFFAVLRLKNVTVLISKKCPYLRLASLFFLIFCSMPILNKQYLIDIQIIFISS